MCLAIPGKLESINGLDTAFRTGRVRFGGISREVNLAMVPEAKEGDYVLVHVGVALQVVDEAEALESFEYLRQIGELEDLGPEPAQHPGL